MGDKYGFKPKFDITLTVRDITHEFAPGVGRILGKCISEINEMARLSKEDIETQIALNKPEMTMHDLKDEAIERALEQVGGNKSAAAKLLGISTRAIYRWVEDKERRQEGESI